jgi:hypothetical protein
VVNVFQSRDVNITLVYICFNAIASGGFSWPLMNSYRLPLICVALFQIKISKVMDVRSELMDLNR